MNFDVTSDIDISKYHLEKNINRFINFLKFGLLKNNKLEIYFSEIIFCFYFQVPS